MTGNAGTTLETVRKANSIGPEAEDLSLRSRRVRYLQEQMKTNSKRDLHLWSISILVILVLATGFAAVIAPSLAWRTASFHFDLRDLPQLFWGMIALVLLFSVYVTAQKKELNATRRTLLQEFVMSEHLQAFSLLDPVTQLLNSCAIDPIVAKETIRANRLGTALAIATISLDNFQSIAKRAGIEQGEQTLHHAARLLKSTFRGSDAIFRSRTSEFVVVMPDTTEQEAEHAIGRLRAGAERWNAEAETGCEFSFSWGIAGYIEGARTSDVLERARRCMFLSSQKINFVF
jgi:diguanylate cyclase (GGDEF)-like protein